MLLQSFAIGQRSGRNVGLKEHSFCRISYCLLLVSLGGLLGFKTYTGARNEAVGYIEAC